MYLRLCVTLYKRNLKPLFLSGFQTENHIFSILQEVEGAEPGTVVTVSKVGYKLHERCVRPALVGVAKGSS